MKRNRLFILTLLALCLMAPRTVLAQTTHVVKQDNVDDIFSGGDNKLGAGVSAGDILDFQGIIDKEHSLVINKQVTVISTTGDAVIRLNSVSSSLTGEDPGNSFVVNAGAAGSTISDLRLENTQTWIYHTSNVTFTNMTMHVENAHVGSGTGHVAVRYSDNVTFDQCTIYTKNNGGTSCFVFTGTSNSTIKNSVFEGEGNIAHLVYLGSPYNTNDKPDGFEVVSNHNTVKGCTITKNDNVNDNISYGIVVNGEGDLIENNTLNRCVISKLFSGGVTLTATSAKNTYRNNILTEGGSLTSLDYGVVENNTIDGRLTVGKEGTATNNTASGLTVSAGATIQNNTINSAVTFSSNQSNITFTGNTVNGTLTVNSSNNTITGNTITSTGTYAITLNNNSTNNTIQDNRLSCSGNSGDAAVKQGTGTGHTIANNKGLFDGTLGGTIANATVKFYVSDKEPTAAPTGTEATTVDTKQWLIIGITPNSGYWIYKDMITVQVAGSIGGAQARQQRAIMVPQNPEALSSNAADGTGYYYYQIPDGCTTENGYTKVIVSGEAVEKIDLSTATLSGTTVTTADRADGWKATITLDKVSWTYDGSAHGPVISEFTLSNGTKTFATPEVQADKDVQVSISGNSQTNANNYNATLTAMATGCLKNSFSSVAFSIGKKTLTITAKPKTITYGDAPANDGVTYSGFIDGENENTTGIFGTSTLSYDYDYTQYDDAGTYTITPKGLTATNYDITFKTGTLTVQQKEVGLAWTPNPATFTYNNSAKAPTAIATGMVNSDAISVTVAVSAKSGSSLTDGKAVNVGSYTATATGLTGDKAGNYKLPTTGLTQDFSITAATMTGVDATEWSGTYDGIAHGITVTAPTGATVKYRTAATGEYDLTTNPTFTNASETPYTVYYQVTKEGYTPVTGSQTVTINKKALTITAKDQSVNFGTAITQGTDQVTTTDLVVGQALTAVTLTQSTTSVTTSGTITPSAATVKSGENDVTANYTITYKPGTLIINASTAASAVVTANDRTYDGSTQPLVTIGTITNGLTGTVADVVFYESDTSTTPLTGIPQGTNAGTYDVYYEVTPDADHTAPARAKVTVTISPIAAVAVTITGHNNTSVFDGKEHSVNGYDVEFSTPLYTEADFTFSGTAKAACTDAGKKMMGLDKSQFTNKNTNFGTVIFNVEDGYQAISPIAAAVTITGHYNTTTYDGTEHSVTGYDVTFSNALYTEADFTFNGTAKAARTDEGTDYMGLSKGQFANTSPNFYPVTFTVIDGYQTITARPLTIIANEQTIDYGSSIATGMGQVTAEGLQGSDKLTAVTLMASTAELTSDGKITPSAVVIKNSDKDVTGNYEISYTAGTLIIEYSMNLKAGYVTFCSPFDLLLPATGMTAYTVSAVSEAQGVELQEQTAIGKDVPMILYVETAGTQKLRKADPQKFRSVPEFVGVTSADGTNVGTIAGEVYILKDGKFVWSREGVVPQYRCYAVLGSSANARSLNIVVGGESSGIDNILWSDEEDGNWYSLDGRKLDGKPTAKGLYIMIPADSRSKGKKVMIK